MKLIYFSCLRGRMTLFMIIKKEKATTVKTDDRKKRRPHWFKKI